MVDFVMSTTSEPEERASPEMGQVVGKPTRAAVSAVIKAHVAVIKGKPLRAAISEQLFAHEKLGGKERRFVAFASRELSRHLRRIDLSAKAHGWPPSKLSLPEDLAILRFALWRKELTTPPPPGPVSSWPCRGRFARARCPTR